jgi:hypothetical protein
MTDNCLYSNLLYSKCQSSIFLFADWSKLPVHKTSCSLYACFGEGATGQQPEVRRELFASTSKFKAKFFKSFGMSAGRFITVSEYQVNY